jgi:hypothetical protein
MTMPIPCAGPTAAPFAIVADGHACSVYGPAVYELGMILLRTPVYHQVCLIEPEQLDFLAADLDAVLAAVAAAGRRAAVVEDIEETREEM